MSASVTAYIGLGSNLDGPQKQIKSAVASLARIEGVVQVTCSQLYRSPPMGPQDQPEYVNAVAAVESGLSALELFHETQNIEKQQGRVREGQRWGPRNIDLDLLLFGSQSVSLPGLKIPHYGIAERAFVLVPLAELAGQFEVPGLGTVESLLGQLDCTSIVPYTT